LLARRRFGSRAPLGLLACLLGGRERAKQLVVGPQQLAGRDVVRDQAPLLPAKSAISARSVAQRCVVDNQRKRMQNRAESLTDP
jgi:hypothetical protein